MGPIKREAVAIALVLALQGPQHQTVGADRGHPFKGRIRSGSVLDAAAKVVDQLRVVIDDLLEFPSLSPQLAGDAVLVQALPERVVMRPRRSLPISHRKW